MLIQTTVYRQQFSCCLCPQQSENLPS